MLFIIWPSKFISLHSTMLLLYLMNIFERTPDKPTLHSTVLLLYLSHSCVLHYFNRLYIPLCFYYIRDTTLSLTLPTSLHSTMLLLYLPSEEGLFVIYYPLHSTMLLLYLKDGYRITTNKILYIPLCFYYITDGSTTTYTVTNFTFHYASTISVWWYNGNWYYADFTFHYASTISKFEHTERTHGNIFTFHYASTISKDIMIDYIFQYCFTFHYASTISVFRPTRFRRVTTLYIPLCFYYIRVEGSNKVYWFNFTFHYASTISCWINDIYLENILYIPLCFYYIYFHSSSFTFFPPLHSTMLLLYPVPVFPFYFLQYRYTFCLPPFLVDFFSKIIHLSLYKV